ncbi:MAG: phosphoribosylformylglycinamidine synthase subunit PurS [Alphaproteobacteria bacterium]|nr:phosphoribosylformylglycinamidine synthase subunit PurS [Alphaproteobacteria bacterium]
MHAVVTIMLKKGVLDPQGKAIGHALEGLGFEGVGEVRQGKVITLEIPDGTGESTVRDMCEKLLANPVIEDYEIEMRT